jgi:hypothetical protein
MNIRSGGILNQKVIPPEVKKEKVMKTLHAPLKELKEEIKKTVVADETGKKKLAELNGNIDKILTDSGSRPGEHHKSLFISLNDSVLYFEASHPKLTGIMNAIITTLADSGL